MWHCRSLAQHNSFKISRNELGKDGSGGGERAHRLGRPERARIAPGRRSGRPDRAKIALGGVRSRLERAKISFGGAPSRLERGKIVLWQRFWSIWGGPEGRFGRLLDALSLEQAHSLEEATTYENPVKTYGV